MSKFNVPSVNDFLSKAPSIESLKSTVSAEITSRINILPQKEELQQKMQDKIMEYVGNIDLENIPQPKTTGEIASSIGSKFGMDIDSSKIDSTIDQIESYKSELTAKAIDKITPALEKIGVNVPPIPTEEQIAQMIVDSNPTDVDKIDAKVAEIEAFIQSKLS